MSSIAPMSPVDFHVLLVLSRGPLYGYAVMKALAEESAGVVTPEIGSLYRILARLVAHGLVEQSDDVPVEVREPHPGRKRKYYALTPAGDAALRDEARRMEGVLALASNRGLLGEGRVG
jgi:DNA-binding PadR family transcriptional regulator